MGTDCGRRLRYTMRIEVSEKGRIIMQKILLAGTACLTLISGSAMAADLRPARARAPVYTKAPVMPAYSWTGCYIGVEGGGAWGRSHHEDASGLAITGDYDVTGGLIGGTLGCNYQVGPCLGGGPGRAICPG